MEGLTQIIASVWNTGFLGIGILEIIISMFIFIAGAISRAFFVGRVLKWLEQLTAHTDSELDDVLLASLKKPLGYIPVTIALYFIAVYLPLTGMADTFATNIIKATEAPYLEYNKKCLDIFFQNTNNMQSIAIIFDKKFLLNHKIKFEKNIYEDIFYIFKCHYYNLKKIDHFTNNIYIKINHQSSITNTKKSLNHVICKFNAFKNIELFLKKKLTKNSFKKLNTSIQYRWRGEFANEYDQIIKSSMNKYKKVIFVNYLKQLYKKKIKKDFLAITNKDKITKNILFNV